MVAAYEDSLYVCGNASRRGWCIFGVTRIYTRGILLGNVVIVLALNGNIHKQK